MNGLPALADAEDVEHVRRICSEGRAFVSRKRDRQTERYLNQVWGVPVARLAQAVSEHIELKQKVFVKFNQSGHRLQGLMEANVTLAEDLDVYVEIELKGDRVVVLAAHSHTPGLRLPQ